MMKRGMLSITILMVAMMVGIVTPAYTIDKQLTYGSEIKLSNVNSGDMALSAKTDVYSNTPQSFKQIGMAQKTDTSTVWIIKSAAGKEEGDLVENLDSIYLQSKSRNYYLSSADEFSSSLEAGKIVYGSLDKYVWKIGFNNIGSTPQIVLARPGSQDKFLIYNKFKGASNQEVVSYGSASSNNEVWNVIITEQEQKKDLRYGCVVSVKHKETNRYLSILNKKYAHQDSSGNYAMYGAQNDSSDSSSWIIEGKNKTYGTKVNDGDTIALKSVALSGKYVSYNGTSKSPTTGQREVYGDDNIDRAWMRYDKNSRGIRFIFSGKWTLHSHGDTYRLGGINYQEITSYDEYDDDNDFWTVSVKEAPPFSDQDLAELRNACKMSKSNLQGQSFTKRIQIVQEVIDSASKLYSNANKPSDVVSTAFYSGFGGSGGLKFIYDDRKVDDSEILNQLSDLITKASSSLLTNKSQKSDLAAWNAQISLEVKRIEFEKDLSTKVTQAVLSGVTSVEGRFQVMQSFIDRSKEIYQKEAIPSDMARNNFYKGSDGNGGLKYVYENRDATNVELLDKLEKLINAATASKLLSDTQKTSMKGWIEQQGLEEKILSFQNDLALQTTAEALIKITDLKGRVDALQALIDTAKTLFTGRIPSDATRINFYQGSDGKGGLQMLYTGRDKTKTQDLVSLSTLINNAFSSVLLSDAQKTGMQTWLTQLDVEQKIVAFETDLATKVTQEALLQMPPLGSRLAIIAREDLMQGFIDAAKILYVNGMIPSDVVRNNFYQGPDGKGGLKYIYQIRRTDVSDLVAHTMTLVKNATDSLLLSDEQKKDVALWISQIEVNQKALIFQRDIGSRTSKISLSKISNANDRIKAMQQVVDEAKTLYSKTFLPSVAVQELIYSSGDGVGGISYLYGSRDKTKSDELNLLISLLKSALEGVLISDDIQLEIKAWLSQLDTDLKMVPSLPQVTTQQTTTQPGAVATTQTVAVSSSVGTGVQTTQSTQQTTPVVSSATTPVVSQTKNQTGLVFGIDEQGNIWMRKDVSIGSEQGDGWIKIDGKAQSLSVSPWGDVWGVGFDGRVYRREGVGSDNLAGNFWSAVESAGVAQIAVNGNQVWSVNVDGSVYYRAGITSDKPQGTGWTNTDPKGSLKCISITTGGNVWGINVPGQAVIRSGMTSDYPFGTSWQVVDSPAMASAEKLEKVAADGNSVWVTGTSGTVWFRDGVTDATPSGSRWLSVGGEQLKSVTVADDGRVWGTKENGQVVTRTGVTETNPQGDGWKQVDGKLSQVAGGHIAEPVVQPAGFIDEDGALLNITAGSANGELDVWGLGLTDNILYHYNQYSMSSSPWDKVSAKDESGNDISKNLISVSVASDGTLCAVNKESIVLRYDRDKEIFGPLMSSGQNLEFDSVIVGHKDLIWAIDKDSRTAYEYTFDGWQIRQQGSTAEVSLAIDGTVVGLNTSNQLYTYSGNNKWSKAVGAPLLSCVAVVDNGEMWGVGFPDGALYHWINNAWTTVNDSNGKPVVGMQKVAVNAAGTVVVVDGAGNAYFNGDKGFEIQKVETKPVEVPIVDESTGTTTVVTQPVVTKVEGSAKMPKKETRHKAKKQGKLKRASKKRIATKAAAKAGLKKESKKGRKHVKKAQKRVMKKAVVQKDKLVNKPAQQGEKKPHKKAATKKHTGKQAEKRAERKEARQAKKAAKKQSDTASDAEIVDDSTSEEDAA